MFGIKVRDKENIKNRDKKTIDDKNKYYVEIKPDTEIIRVDNKEQLKALNELEEIKALPEQLPKLKENEVCGHWERELVFLSESNPELWHKTRDDIITGGYCPDCGADLGQPKPKWHPTAYYKKKKITGV